MNSASRSTFSSLRNRDFRYLWAGTCFLSGGLWIQQVTLGWATYEMTGSSILLGAINGLRFVPFLIFSPLAGVAADRTDRRRLMMTTQWCILLTALGMGLVVSLGLLEVWHLFAFTLVTGVVWSFSEPVRQALIPDVVPRAELMNAVALNSAAFNFTKIIGPSVGGVLIVAFGLAGNFYIQSATYLFVLWMIYRMHVPVRISEAAGSSVLSNLREGIRYVWAEPVVFAVMATAMIPRLFAMPYQALLPIFQKDVLQVGADGLGLMMAAPGLGAMLAMLSVAHFASRVSRPGLLMLAALVLQGIFLALFALVHTLPLALLTLVIVGGFQVLFMSVSNMVLHMTVPDQLRGRVMSIYMLDRGITPAGALLAGISAHFVGAPYTVMGMGALVLALAAVVILFLPSLRKVRA
ncbi:MAG: MFS transporter [Deltaproteobacteria bacterium]|nr:MFS transporter [Deltaproteobacteria bacterium]